MLANRTFFGPMFSVYQAELPAHGSRRFSGLFVKSSLWGRRRDIPTQRGALNPGHELHWPRLLVPFRLVRYQATQQRPRGLVLCREYLNLSLYESMAESINLNGPLALIDSDYVSRAPLQCLT